MLRNYLSLIKFSHTIFALPFAMVGFFLGVRSRGTGMPWDKLMLVLLAMVFARSAAMAFNRYVDRKIDRANPRTAGRELASGKMRASHVLVFVLLNALLFVVVSYFINRLCFVLSPVALAVILGYSYTKRFTALSHFILGLGLGLAPVGAYLAVTGRFDALPILFGIVVFTWVAGFDILYALQDEAFDRAMQLHSIPSLVGRRRALLLSTLTHIVTAGVLFYTVWQLTHTHLRFGWLTWLGSILFLFSLLYQHLLVKDGDLSKINLAFFTTNGMASLLFGALFLADWALS